MMQIFLSVIPAKAGIQQDKRLDPRFREDDRDVFGFNWFLITDN